MLTATCRDFGGLFSRGLLTAFGVFMCNIANVHGGCSGWEEEARVFTDSPPLCDYKSLFVTEHLLGDSGTLICIMGQFENYHFRGRSIEFRLEYQAFPF